MSCVSETKLFWYLATFLGKFLKNLPLSGLHRKYKWYIYSHDRKLDVIYDTDSSSNLEFCIEA